MLICLGENNTFTIQARDRFDNDIKVGGAQISGSVKSPSGKDVPIKAVDNNNGTFTCSYPDIKEDGVHSLVPQLNGETIKDAPFKLTVQAGEPDYDNFEILWGEMGPDGQVVIAGEEKKFSVRAKVHFFLLSLI